MEFCDMECKYASHPKSAAVDGSGSCRTFVALYCSKKKSLVFKNMPCAEKAVGGMKPRGMKKKETGT